MMAKAAASLDVLSSGRFELGLGACVFPGVIAGYGGPRRTPGESVEALEEAIDVIRLLWSEERSVSYAGKHYRLDGAPPRPAMRAPDRDLGGAFKPRMLRLVGRKADGWLPSLGVLARDELRAGNELIDAAAAKGRPSPALDPADHQRSGRGRRTARALPVDPPGGLSGWRTTRRTTGLVGRDARRLRRRRLRLACSGRWRPRPARSSCSHATLHRTSIGPVDRSHRDLGQAFPSRTGLATKCQRRPYV
jgi:alkanesulfonate monooxygenase SsuD/methylene tetrahydromethanopterin reductase-like flavin-dependent oxidoreductase (luciferase family)